MMSNPGHVATGYDTRRPGPFGGPIQPNYPMNQWWVAAASAEVGRTPLSRWLLGKPILLYRKESGAVVALDDRCPHRWAPLSSGYLSGDNIVCGYHGFEFGPNGQCVRIPTQSSVPAKARVASYRLVEQSSLIWIWLGDEVAAETAPGPVAIPFLEDSRFSNVRGYTRMEANYMLLKENVLDLTHFGYVHRNTFQITDWTRAPVVTVEDGQVRFVLDFPECVLPPLFGALTGFGSEKTVSRSNWGCYVNPALHLAGVDFHDPTASTGARQNVAFRIAHATTPVSPTAVHYFWAAGWDVPLTASQMTLLHDTTVKGFKEDEDMLVSIQQRLTDDPWGTQYAEVMASADQPSVQARRQLQMQLDRERSAVKPGGA